MNIYREKYCFGKTYILYIKKTHFPMLPMLSKDYIEIYGKTTFSTHAAMSNENLLG